MLREERELWGGGGAGADESALVLFPGPRPLRCWGACGGAVVVTAARLCNSQPKEGPCQPCWELQGPKTEQAPRTLNCPNHRHPRTRMATHSKSSPNPLKASNSRSQEPAHPQCLPQQPHGQLQAGPNATASRAPLLLNPKAPQTQRVREDGQLGCDLHRKRVGIIGTGLPLAAVSETVLRALGFGGACFWNEGCVGWVW